MWCAFLLFHYIFEVTVAFFPKINNSINTTSAQIALQKSYCIRSVSKCIYKILLLYSTDVYNL